MSPREKPMSTSRTSRAARLGGLAAFAAARTAGTKAVNVARSDEASKAADQRAMLDTADRMVSVLGTMRGGAMKIGQTLSMFEFGILDDEVRAEFQAKLAVLQARAPSVRFQKMRKVIEADLDASIGETFAEFDEQAIASASIGQVYHARLHDGRQVAIKVQYPGIDRVVASDMKNLNLILKAFARIAPGIDSKELADELVARIVDELDYELEAANQHALARQYRNDPDVVVPDVISGLSGSHVLVTEYVEGKRFAEILTESQDVRDHVGRALFRFYLCDPHRHRLLNGDPHPGNCLLLPDGRLGFLDFGFFKHLTTQESDGLLSVVRALLDHNEHELYSLSVNAGTIDASEDAAPELMATAETALGWLTAEGEVTMTPQIVNGLMTTYASIGKKFGHFQIPPSQGVMVRVVGLVAATLGQLNATGNWRALATDVAVPTAPVQA